LKATICFLAITVDELVSGNFEREIA